MRILITGATGLIGKALVSSLIEKGHSINYLTTSKDKIANKENYKGFYWNPTKAEIDVNCIKNVSAIIHLAGATIAKRWTNAYKKEILDSRVLSANLLFKTLQENPHQVNQFISASGIAAYPDSQNKTYTEEYKEYDNQFLGKVVQKWEASAFQFQKIGIKTACLRTGVVFAENGGALEPIIKPIKIGIGAVLGNGKQKMSWIALEDLIQMYEFVLMRELEGIFNAVTENPVTNKDLTYALAKKLNKKILLPNVPKFVLKLLLGEMATLVFEDKNCQPKRFKDEGYKFSYNNITNLLDHMKFN